MEIIEEDELQRLNIGLDEKIIKLLENLIYLIYEEMNASHLGSIAGSSFIATSDNIVQWMLNTNSSNIINSWFKLNGTEQNIVKYALLINGVISNTAIDIYASSNLIKIVTQTIRRLKIIPDYRKWFITVIALSILISIFGVSGISGLTFNLYIASLVRAITFSIGTVFVNLFTSTFFFQSQFDLVRNQFLQRNADQINALNALKLALLSLSYNIANLSAAEYEQLHLHLKQFHAQHRHTAHQLREILEILRPLFRPIEAPRHTRSSLHSSNSCTILKYLPALLFSAFAAWLYYCVGTSTIENFLHNLHKHSPEILDILVGSSMGIIASITVWYSSNQLVGSLIKSNNNNGGFSAQPTRTQLLILGKTLLNLIISCIASLAVLNLVDIALGNDSSIIKKSVYVIAVIQQTIVVANAILQTTPKEFLENIYIDVGRLFVRNIQAEQKRAKENIESLSHQLDLASNNDIQNLNMALSDASLIEPLSVPSLNRI